MPREIIFLQPNHHYDSYQDFWWLVQIAGFEIRSIHDADFSRDVVYITTPWNGETDGVLGDRGRNAKARKIFWLLERPDAPGRPSIAAVLDQALALVDEVWVSDRWYAAQDPRLKFVFMGSHPYIGNPQDRRPYDFAHISYAYGRRADIYANLRAAGFQELGNNIQAAPPSQRRMIELGSTKAMINLQQYPTARIAAPIRFAVAAANKMALLSEPLEDAYPLVRGEHFLDGNLVDGLRRVIHTPDLRDTLGEQLYRLCCLEQPFRTCVEEAVG